MSLLRYVTYFKAHNVPHTCLQSSNVLQNLKIYAQQCVVENKLDRMILEQPPYTVGIALKVSILLVHPLNQPSSLFTRLISKVLLLQYSYPPSSVHTRVISQSKRSWYAVKPQPLMSQSLTNVTRPVSSETGSIF